MGIGSYVLTNGTAVISITGFYKIPRERRRVPDASRTVLVGLVKEGTLKVGDKVILEGPGGATLNDVAARLEINRRNNPEVKKGDGVGILLTKHTPKELMDFGVRQRFVRTPGTRHP